MRRWFAEVVFALARTLQGERPAPAGEVAGFVLEQLDRMPDPLRPLLVFATLAFDLSPLPRHGKPFRRLGPEARALVLRRWRRSRLQPCRDLVRLYESLSVFAAEALAEGPARSAPGGGEPAG